MLTYRTFLNAITLGLGIAVLPLTAAHAGGKNCTRCSQPPARPAPRPAPVPQVCSNACSLVSIGDDNTVHTGRNEVIIGIGVLDLNPGVDSRAGVALVRLDRDANLLCRNSGAQVSVGGFTTLRTPQGPYSISSVTNCYNDYIAAGLGIPNGVKIHARRLKGSTEAYFANYYFRVTTNSSSSAKLTFAGAGFYKRGANGVGEFIEGDRPADIMLNGTVRGCHLGNFISTGTYSAN